MHYERLKTIILMMLIVSSFVLSFSLWSGWRQYDALPAWLTQPVTLKVESDPSDPLPTEPEEPEKVEVEPSQIISPERMIIHNNGVKYLFWMQPNSLLHAQWQGFSMLMRLVDIQDIAAVSASDWWQDVEKLTGCEFIMSANYALEVLFPDMLHEEVYAKLKVDRLFVSEELHGDNEQQAAIYARSIYDHTYYRINVTLPKDSTLLLNWEANNYNWIEAEDLHDEQLSVSRGVYAPVNLINTHAQRFPEVWVKYENLPARTWLPLFFSNVNIVREITFSDDHKRVYVDGPVKLSLDYSIGTAIEYAKAPLNVLSNHSLNAQATEDQTTILSILKDVFSFVATHNPNGWPPLADAVRLDGLEIDSIAGTADLSLKCYTVNTEYMIPIEAQGHEFKVSYEDGMVTNYNRSILVQGRRNSQPQLSLEAYEALDQLSEHSWRLDTWWNPHAPEVIAAYRGYIEQGYVVEDIYLAYYSQLNSDRGEFMTPHWVVVLVNAEGQAVKFFVNAMTGYMPLENGISFTP